MVVVFGGIDLLFRRLRIFEVFRAENELVEAAFFAIAD
jgi:hypothetical protein